MGARQLQFMSVCVCVASMLLVAPAWGKASNELAAFAENAAAALGASPLTIPQFRSAKVDAIEELGKANGTDRYLCWLKTDPNRVGYIAVAASGGSFQVLALSATTLPPQYFLKHLEVTQLSARPIAPTHANQLSSVADVPLVAAGRTFLGADAFDISDLAASLSSVLNYWQSKNKVLLFGHVGPELPEIDPEYTRRFTENPASMREPNDPESAVVSQGTGYGCSKRQFPAGAIVG